MEKQANLAHFFRHLWEEKDLIIVSVDDIDELIKGREAYNLRYKIKPDDFNQTENLIRFFTAAGLAAVSLVDRESWGWSMSLPASITGYFAAVEPEGMVCGKLLTSPINKAHTSVQRQKAGEGLTQSHFIPLDSDPVHTVEQYFKECDQSKTRLVVGKNGDYKNKAVLVKALPGGDFDAVSGLSDEELLDLCFKMLKEDSMKGMAEVLLFYECRCTEEMILNMVTSLPKKQRQELWGDLKQLKVDCPRCSRSYTINRAFQ